MDNQKYGMLFETSPNSHYYFDAGTGKVITCSTEERDFIEKVLDGTLSLEKAKEINTEFKDFPCISCSAGMSKKSNRVTGISIV